MKVLVIYNSKTGFTEKYALAISKKLNCEAVSLDKLKNNLDDYDLLIFGSRIIAGKIQKLGKIKSLIKNKAIIFTTGSTPNSATDEIEKMRNNNFTKEELDKVPHFHFQSGMCLEKLPLVEKIMIKMALLMIKNKKTKDDKDREFEKALTTSFDIYDENLINSLVDYVKVKYEK